MTSCAVISAIVCVLVTAVAVIVAFATPNWVKFENLPVLQQPDTLCDCSNCECGLWLHCIGGFTDDGSIDNCRWFFSNDFRIEKKLPSEFVGVLMGMYGWLKHLVYILRKWEGRNLGGGGRTGVERLRFY